MPNCMEHNKYLVWAFMHANLTKLKKRATMSIACNRCTKQKKLERAFPHTARQQTIGKSNTCHTVLTTILPNLVRSNFHLCSFCRADCCCPRAEECVIPFRCHSALGSLQLWRQLLGHTKLRQPGEFVRHFIEFTKHMLCDDFFNVVQLEHQSDFCSNPILKR